jgi:hypothetical protein
MSRNKHSASTFQAASRSRASSDAAPLAAASSSSNPIRHNESPNWRLSREALMSSLYHNYLRELQQANAEAGLDILPGSGVNSNNRLDDYTPNATIENQNHLQESDSQDNDNDHDEQNSDNSQTSTAKLKLTLHQLRHSESRTAKQKKIEDTFHGTEIHERNIMHSEYSRRACYLN